MSRTPEDSKLQQLRRGLLELELGPEALQDRSGESWLPPSLLHLVQSDPACRAELQAFVSAELACLRELDLGRDPFFTTSVMRALPEAPPVGVDGRARTRALALGYGLAILSAYASLWFLPVPELWSWLEYFHGLFDAGLQQEQFLGLLASACILLFGLSLWGQRSHTPLA